MRLADFILENVDPILMEWEAFARSIWPGTEVSPDTLRDHAADMLVAVAHDMKSNQTDFQQSEKSKGHGGHGDRVDTASDLHTLSRLASGFDLRELVAEYRALRASVIRLWLLRASHQDLPHLDDMIRFNESIDQLLAEAVPRYTRQVEESREIFLGILGHDLRNPLHVINFLAQTLVESGDLDGHSLKTASMLSESVTVMSRLVKNFLDFTTTRLGAKMGVFPTVIDLKPLCREMLDEMEAVHPMRTFAFECPDGDIIGKWDGARLRQLISNLICNAIQHGFRATPIILSIQVNDEEVILAVRSKGASIPPDSIELIFKPLRRKAMEEFSSPPGSLGLGLYIAREVAIAHGGFIGVQSELEETVFTVSLPRHHPFIANISSASRLEVEGRDVLASGGENAI